MWKKPKRNGMDEYLRRAGKLLSGTRVRRKKALDEIRGILHEIPYAQTMSFEILCAAAGTPEEITERWTEPASFRQRKKYLYAGVWISLLCVVALIVFSVGWVIRVRPAFPDRTGDVQTYYAEEIPPELLEQLTEYSKSNKTRFG